MRDEMLYRMIKGRIAEEVDRAAAQRERLGPAASQRGRRRRARSTRTARVREASRVALRAITGFGAGARRAWRASREMYVTAYGVDHPWELEGPLRWRRIGATSA